MTPKEAEVLRAIDETILRLVDEQAGPRAVRSMIVSRAIYVKSTTPMTEDSLRKRAVHMEKCGHVGHKNRICVEDLGHQGCHTDNEAVWMGI